MRSILTGLAVFISLIIVTQYLAYERYIIASDEQKRETQVEADIIRDNLKSGLSYSLAATKTLGFIVNHYGIPEDFDSIARTILQSSKYIDALELTRGGVIMHVFPREGNESVIGYDVFADPIRGPEAKKALEKGSLYFAGPFALKQGGTGVVGRLPLYEDDKFIGFSVVLIKLTTLLKAAGIDEENPTFYYQLSKKSIITGKEEFFLDKSFPVEDALTSIIDVPDGEWKLYVTLRKTSGALVEALPFSILGVFFSAIAGLFVWFLVRQPERLSVLVTHKTSQILALNRLLEFTKAINKLMARLDDEQIVYQEVCSIAVNVGRFSFAWIGKIDQGSKLLTFGAQSENDDGKYLEDVLPIDLTKSFEGPIKKMIRTDQYVYCNDIATDPLYTPWVKRAISYGYHSCIFLPLRREGKIVASLNLYSSTGYTFDTEEIRLLLDVAEDISFTLDNIERERKFQHAVKLTEAEKLVSDSIINSLPGIFYLYDRDLKFVRWNKNFETISGYSSDEIRRMSPIQFFDKKDQPLLLTKIRNVFETGHSEVVADFFTRDGRHIPYYFNGRKTTLEGKDHLIGMGIDITEQVQTEHELRQRTKEIEKLTTYMEQVREEERRNISREIHDELGQQLTGLKMDSSWLKKNLEHDQKLSARLSDMLQLIDETIQTVRRISSQLRPGILDDIGLVAALEWLCSDFEKRTSIRIQFTSNAGELALEEKISVNIFRIFQESLTNILRHANAKNVVAQLMVEDQLLKMEIADDGQGISNKNIRADSFGIVGMRERARLLNAELSITGAEPAGTIVTFTVPINQTIPSANEIPDLR